MATAQNKLRWQLVNNGEERPVTAKRPKSAAIAAFLEFRKVTCDFQNASVGSEEKRMAKYEMETKERLFNHAAYEFIEDLVKSDAMA